MNVDGTHYRTIWLKDDDWKMYVTVGGRTVRNGEVDVDDGEVENVRLWF